MRISLLTLRRGAPAFGQLKFTLNLNCTRGDSLANAVANALPNTLINIKGACTGPVSITTNGIQLNAVGAASINGAGKDAVTITGAQRVTLTGLSITGGANGIVAQNGAQVLLQNDTVAETRGPACRVLANSSVTVTGGSSQGNGLFGIDVEATSALVVTGSYSITGNAVFGIDVNNGSSLTLTAATPHCLAEHARHSAWHQCFGIPRWSIHPDCQPELQRRHHHRLGLTRGGLWGNDRDGFERDTRNFAELQGGPRPRCGLAGDFRMQIWGTGCTLSRGRR